MSYRLLLVDPDRPSVIDAERGVALRSDYVLRSVGTFAEALAVMAVDLPDLLLVAVRLGAYNGTHLILRCRALYPSLPSFLIGRSGDHSVDVDQLGIRYVEQPLTPERLLDAIADSLQTGKPLKEKRRRWPRLPAQLPANISEDFGRVVNLSYGGLRIESGTAPALGAPMDIAFPTLGFAVTGVARWQTRKRGAKWVSGVEVRPAGLDVSRRWRDLVDSQD